MSDEIREIVDGAEEVQLDLAAEVERLAALPRLEYEKCRKEEAKRLGIDRVAVLDTEVERRRKTNGYSDSASIQGRAITLPEPDPWPDPVDGAALMQETVAAIRRYLSLPPHADHALAFWAIHTHLFDAFDVTPRIQLTSPLPECGKTTTLRVLRKLVNRPLMSGNVSPAVVFRTVELARPTLLIDEADTFAKQNDELRGVLNSGHERNGSVIRSVGDDNEPRQFSTWTPMAIAAIDRLPATLESRAIIIEMQRRPHGVKLDRLRDGKPCGLDDIARRIARWARDNRRALEDADPDMPDELGDRAQDNWRPLFAIADLIGGDWTIIARQSALALSSRNADNEPTRVLLLSDLRDIFGDAEAQFTKDILAQLHGMDDRPWREWGRKGNPISDIQLARQLKPFKIISTTLNLNGERSKGYRKRDLDAVFTQYLLVRPVTSLQPKETAAFSDYRPVTSMERVTGWNLRKPAENLDGNEVTGQNTNASGETPIKADAAPDGPPLAGEVEWTA